MTTDKKAEWTTPATLFADAKTRMGLDLPEFFLAIPARALVNSGITPPDEWEMDALADAIKANGYSVEITDYTEPFCIVCRFFKETPDAVQTTEHASNEENRESGSSTRKFRPTPRNRRRR